MLYPHELALFNYLNNLLPHVRSEFDTMLRNRAATLNYSWMPAVVRYVDDPSYRHDFVDHGTMGPTPRRQELKALPLAQFPDAATAQITQEFYGEQAVVSADYLYYATNRLQLTTDLRKHLANFAETAVKRERAQVLNIYANAFTTAGGFQTWEGKALCDTGHHNVHDPAGNTYDNFLTDAFSYTALEKIDQNHTAFVGPDGQGMMLNFDTIITGPALKNTVRKTLESLREPGGNKNDINIFQGEYRHVIVPDFQNAIIAGSHLWWFVLDSQQHSLELVYGKRPQINLVRAENARDWAYMHEFDLVADWYGPFGIVGSDGTT